MRYIIFVVIAFFILIFGYLLFGGGGSNKPASQPKKLADYADTDAEMQFTTSGVINGDDAHREIVISVGRNQRTARVIQGYQGTVIKSESLPNNEAAYSAFLSALDGAGFTKKRDSKSPSEAGLCPLGQRFVYEITNDGSKDSRTWATSCGGTSTFAGNKSLVQQLFQLQITNYGEFTNEVEL